MKQRTEMGEIVIMLTTSLDTIRRLLPATPEAEEAFATLDTYCAMSTEVLSGANPSKVRAAAKNAELRRFLPPSPRSDISAP